MEFFDSAYNYVISAVIGILLALCSMLMALRVPKGRKYIPYGKARVILILLFATIAVDLILSLVVNRLHVSVHADTLVDVACYTPIGILFLALMQTLMEYNPKSNIMKTVTVGAWIALTVLGVVNEVLYAYGMVETDIYKTVFMAVAVLWVIVILGVAVRVTILFRKAQHRLSNYYSDDVSKRMEWLLRSFGIFLAWGVMSPLAAMGPSWLNTIYGGLGGAVYLYLAISFINYRAIYANIKANEPDDAKPDATLRTSPRPANLAQTQEAIKQWEVDRGYRTKGVTIEMMSASTAVPADTLASVINEQHNCSFYEYVTELRIRDAQSQLIHYADKSLDEIADMTGFASLEDMEFAFKQTLYVTPEDWRKGVLSLIS